jgi:hypothetical protein
MNIRLIPIQIFCIAFLGLISASLSAQEVRSYNGFGNNIDNPHYGTVRSPLSRLAPIAFEDGYASPAATERANPRQISNVLFDQPDGKADEDKRSDYIWVFGQFLDHDITLIPFDDKEPINIEVPPCDEMFDPNCDGIAQIPMSRSIILEGTGTGEGNPRLFPNQITHWLDGSGVYGSTEEHANWLRTFQGGKMKVSSGDLLPFNTVDGEFNSPIDPNAPHMDNMNPLSTRLFVAGDPRINENPNLMSMHTLFVREHNRLCDELIVQHPDWSDEELFQHARRIVIGQIQNITNHEWLPAIGIELDPYAGYQADVRPEVSVEFASAAFRMGHTLVSSRIIRMDDHCDPMPSGDMDLRSGFFNPRPLIMEEGIEPFLKGMSAQIQQFFDCKLVDDLRNFLFMAPEAGLGMDLASININRAREMGVPDFNTIRESIGLERIVDFEDICQNDNFNEDMKNLYGSVDNIDPWVGFLAEDKMPEMLFGRTVAEIIKEQFQRLRDADRFYFEIDPGLTPQEVEEIKNTRMADIVLRNTDINLMQENVFFAAPECDMTKIDLARINLEMKIYPNPTVDYFNLALYSTSEQEIEYEISSSAGQVMESGQMSLTPGMNPFSMALRRNWPTGTYIIKVMSRNGDINSGRILKVENK